MDPNAAHLISFALDVSKAELDGLLNVADERCLTALSNQLLRHRDALAEVHLQFSAKSEKLQGLAERMDEIAKEIADIEHQLGIVENDQSIHCALAASYLSVEASFARGDKLA